MTHWFIDGTPARAEEIRPFFAGIPFELAELPSGFAASAPEPEPRARDKLMADQRPGFAEAVDLTTMDGRSLRIELDSENESRFCRHWRETPVRLHLCVAYRRSAGSAIEVISVTCDGTIAAKPAGATPGWDRLFVPAGQRAPLALLTDQKTVWAGPAANAYRNVALALRVGQSAPT